MDNTIIIHKKTKQQELEHLIKRVERCKKFGDVTSNGVVFDWGLAGPGGAWFTLFKEKHHTEEDIKQAKHYLHAKRDVVDLYVKKVY
jgi:hypothetical protein